MANVLLQPSKQRRPYSCYPVCWRGTWAERLHKNKPTEKNPESEEDLLEHRTDGTDAFDTLYIGCEKFQQHDFYGVAVGGVR